MNHDFNFSEYKDITIARGKDGFILVSNHEEIKVHCKKCGFTIQTPIDLNIMQESTCEEYIMDKVLK